MKNLEFYRLDLAVKAPMFLGEIIVSGIVIVGSFSLGEFNRPLEVFSEKSLDSTEEFLTISRSVGDWKSN